MVNIAWLTSAVKKVGVEKGLAEAPTGLGAR
jgi:hypothetical protein